MVTFNQLHSILTIDGKNYAVDRDQWAIKTLSETELPDFVADRELINAYYGQYILSGDMTTTPITETVITSVGSIQVVVGTSVTSSELIEDHPKDIEWEQRFAADPRVAYSAKIQQS